MEVAVVANEVPSAASAIVTLMAVTWRRFLRGRALWVALVIAAFPFVIGSLVHDDDPVKIVSLFVMGLLPPVFVASAIGEEIEERTSTYLWSRPLPRWTLLVGKVLALAPIATALIVGGWFIAMQAATNVPPSARSILAFTAGGLAVSAMSAGIGALVPKHGMALSIVYFVIIDVPVGAIPASVQTISVTRQVRLLAGMETSHGLAKPAITLLVLCAIWLALGLWRVRRLES